MTTWVTFRDAVKAAVVAAEADTSVVVQWKDDARKHANDLLLLSVVSSVPVYNRDCLSGDPITQELTTMMRINVQVVAESQHNARSLTVVEKARINLRLLSVVEALRVAGVAMSGFPAETVPVSYKQDRRTVNAHAFDVAFNTVFDNASAVAETIDKITSTELDGELEQLDGSIVDLEFTIP